MILKILDGVDGSPFTRIPGNPVTLVWNALSQRIEPWRQNQDDLADLKTFVNDRCQFVQVVTDDPDEASSRWWRSC